MHRRALAIAVGALALAVPSVAQAATTTVSMGTPPEARKALEAVEADANTYFPRTVTIGVGDTVSFVPNGLHTVELLGKGAKPTPLLSPQGPSGGADAAGQPFWFADQPKLGFTTSLLQSGFGKTFTAGAKGVSSGLPLAEKNPPVKVRFPKAGTYSYLCNLHPDMTGTVKVRKGRGASARAVRRSVAKQVAATVRAAKQVHAQKAPANTVLLGTAKKAGGGTVDHFAMVPAKLEVPVGTTVDFRMPAQSDEVHSATFGPGSERDPKSYLGEILASFQSPSFDSRGVYPSEPPGTTATLTPGLHGNGFWNSGLLAAAPDGPKTGGLPASSRVTFGAAGTYSYLCVIHPFMKGQVTVR